jgi:hypothetical protein
LRLLACELAGAADRLGLLAGTLLGGLLVIITELHLAEDAFTLHFLLQGPEGLIDIVIADDDLHASIISELAFILGLKRTQIDPSRADLSPASGADLAKEPFVVQAGARVFRPIL